jgi:hypothetical protein
MFISLCAGVKNRKKVGCLLAFLRRIQSGAGVPSAAGLALHIPEPEQATNFWTLVRKKKRKI